MHEIVIIQSFIRQNQKNMKITKKVFKYKRKIVTKIFWKKDIKREYERNRYKNMSASDK